MTLQAAIERLGNEIDLGNLTPQELTAILERERIVRMLARFGWNQCAAANAMGVHRNTLMRRMEILGIEKPVDVPTKYSPRVGRPATPKGELAKALGLRTRQMSSNGLDREVSPLVMRLRMKQMERTATKRKNRKAQETERVEKMLVITEKLTALEKLMA